MERNSGKMGESGYSRFLCTLFRVSADFLGVFNF